MNRKATSPFLATFVIVAIALFLCSPWASDLVGIFTTFKEKDEPTITEAPSSLFISQVELTGDKIGVHVINQGESTATIDSLYLDAIQVPVSTYVIPPGGSEIVWAKLPKHITQGQKVEVKIASTQGGILAGYYGVVYAQSSGRSQHEKGSKSKSPAFPVFAHYGVWYRTSFNLGYWSYWDAGGHSCDTIVYEDWRRDIMVDWSANPRPYYYPLVGPYDMTNEEVIRWHFRLAKACGIGLLKEVDIENYALKESYKSQFLPHFMKAAVDYGVPWGVWMQSDFLTYAQWVAAAVDEVNMIKSNPNLYRVNGQILFVTYGVYNKWTPTQINQFVADVEAQTGEKLFALVEYGCNIKNPTDPFVDQVASEPNVDGIAAYIYLDDDQYLSYTVDQFVAQYAFSKSRLHAYGKVFMESLIPGYDDRGKYNGAPKYHGVIDRQNGELFKRQIEAAKQVGLDMCCIVNFNDFGEQTQIEPSLQWSDPYMYLKLTASLTGKTFRVPDYPPVGCIDPVYQMKFQLLTSQFPSFK